MTTATGWVSTHLQLINIIITLYYYNYLWTPGSCLVYCVCKPELLSERTLCSHSLSVLVLPATSVNCIMWTLFCACCHCNAVSVSAEKTNSDTAASWLKSKLNLKWGGVSYWLCSMVSVFMTLSVRNLMFYDQHFSIDLLWLIPVTQDQTNTVDKSAPPPDHSQRSSALHFSLWHVRFHAVWNEAVFNLSMYRVYTKEWCSFKS
jgi:hypothetical protein